MTKLLQTLRGIAALTIMLLSTLLGFIPLLPVALVKLLAPWPGIKRRATGGVLWVARNWIHGSTLGVVDVGGGRVHYEQTAPDDPDGRYVLISNHQCWADTLLKVDVILPQFPFPRFFIKEQLRWLPVVGLACWALDFPFMKRYSRAQIEKNPELRNKDVETVRRSCAVFQEWPVTIINYAEGTRSNPQKRAAADSPYVTMLPPKAGGTAFAVNGLGDLLDGILDMTIAYVNTPEPTLWDFVCGRIPDVVIKVRALQLPENLKRGDYTNDPEYRQQFKTWLEGIWAEKDAEVAAIQDPENPQTRFTPDTGAQTTKTVANA